MREFIDKHRYTIISIILHVVGITGCFNGLENECTNGLTAELLDETTIRCSYFVFFMFSFSFNIIFDIFTLLFSKRKSDKD